MGPTFVLQALPVAALGAVGTIAGVTAGRMYLGAEFLTIALTLGLASFAAAHTFRGSMGWMSVFVAGVSFAAGIVLSRLPSMADPVATRLAVAAAILSLGLGAVAGRALVPALGRFYPPLWAAAWLMRALLVVAHLTGAAQAIALPLGGITFALFLGLAATWFARLPAEPRPALALDLYLLGLNLFLSAGVLQTASA